MVIDFIIVIPTAGRPDLLRRTLTSLAQCRLPDGYVETIVVENGPKRGADEVVCAMPASLKARYVHVELANKSNALNLVLATITDGLIYFTDDDVRYEPETLCAFAAAAEGTTAGRFYGGVTAIDYERQPPDWVVPFLPNASRGSPVPEQPVGKFLVLGCNWAAFANDLKKLGGFNAAVGPGGSAVAPGQETEMQTRLLRAGCESVHVPSAKVWHWVPPERCSPDYAVSWSYRASAYFGMQDFQPDWPFVLGFPRWKIRKGLGVLWDLARAYTIGNERQRFAAFHQFKGFCGYLHGVRLARRATQHSSHCSCA